MATRQDWSPEPRRSRARGMEDVTGEPSVTPTTGPALGREGEEIGARGKEGVASRVKHKASDLAESGKAQVAGGLDSAGNRLDETASNLEAQGGVKAPAGKVLHKAGDALEGGAEYLRSNRLSNIGSDITDQIRSHPLVSAGVALGTGFVLGRITGGGEEEEEELRERERVRGFRKRGEEEPGMFNGVGSRLGGALLAGVTALAARRIRDTVAGR